MTYNEPITFFCIILTAFDLFLIVYALTIPLYPQKWRDKVNKNTKMKQQLV